jgi:hypothetical protein
MLQIFELVEAKYTEGEESLFLPGLTRAILNEHLEMNNAVGQTEALNAFAR